MLAGRTWDDLIAEYAESHQNRWNKLLHVFGIPMIVVSVAMLVLAPFVAGLWIQALLLLASGGVLLFIGHAIEGRSPDVRREWRFLLVGLRWWVAMVTGRLT
jgi:uncharacterized membrane protein YGL010W